ncbi:MAG: hypothetical protein ACRC76_11045 [Proteocatella sp.]
MKKQLNLLLILLILLTGCQQEITTYKEVIKDGKVEIDGITYNIKSSYTVGYLYDENKNKIESRNLSSNDDRKTEYIYKDNKLIEDRTYSNGSLTNTMYYYYDGDNLIKTNIVSPNGIGSITEYIYKDNTKKQIVYNTDGSVSYTLTAYLDDDGKTIRITDEDDSGNFTDLTTLEYKDDLLISEISEKDGVVFRTNTYEYNNLGDKIKDCIIFSGDINVMYVKFYDYEYDENLLKKTMTISEVQSNS